MQKVNPELLHNTYLKDTTLSGYGVTVDSRCMVGHKTNLSSTVAYTYDSSFVLGRIINV